MDTDPNQEQPPRKLRFQPRKNVPPKPRAAKTKARDEDESASDQAILRHLRSLARSKPKKEEKKASDQVAFGPGESSSLRTVGSGSGKSSGIGSTCSAEEQDVLTNFSTHNEDQSDPANATARKIKKVYKEPWDYEHDNYPVTLPLRPPNYGDPEKLDEKEFGDAATHVEYDENTVNSARELGLLDSSEEPKMLFFQLPPSLPKMILSKQQVRGKGKDKIGASAESTPPENFNDLINLPKGHLGKILVYKSGKMKLKIGETLFDVFSGINPASPQDLIALNTANKRCANLGPVTKMAVGAIDTDSLGP